jgi:hypothetical protein
MPVGQGYTTALSTQIAGVWRDQELSRAGERREEKKGRSGRCSLRAGRSRFGRISSSDDGLGRPAVLDSDGGVGLYAGGGAQLGKVRGGTHAGLEPSPL